MLQPNGAGDYVFVAGAKQHTVAFLDVILFTSKASYEFTVPALTIDRPSEVRVSTFRSAGVIVHGLPGEPYLGTSISSLGTSCGASRLVAPALVTASSAPAGSDRPNPFISSVLKDTYPPGGAIEPERVAGSAPPPCLQPFAQPHTNIAYVPAYPDIAREQGAVGMTSIEVRLDASGRVTQREVRKSAGNVALDAAALQAAGATSYVPAIFNCRPDSGLYLFRAQFKGRL